MQTTTIQLKDLREAEYNPRIMPEDRQAQLERSIKEFGVLEFVVINTHSCEQCGDRNNILIGGHQKTKAARELGHTEITAVQVDYHLEQEIAANLALNKNGGEFDGTKLRKLVKEIKKENPDADLTLSGLTPDETANLMAPIEVPETAAFAKVPDTDEPDDTQMSFTVSRRQKAIILQALNQTQQKHNTPIAESVEETLGFALVALSKEYNGHENNNQENRGAAKADSGLQPAANQQASPGSAESEH
jgi:ParB-like chromosome segregation protein Spo0J